MTDLVVLKLDPCAHVLVDKNSQMTSSGYTFQKNSFIFLVKTFGNRYKNV